MKLNKILCYILSVLMIVSMLCSSGMVLADETTADATTQAAGETAAEDGEKAEGEEGEGEEGEEGEETDEYQMSRDYLTEKYTNEEHKLSTMTKYFEDQKYEIWGLQETGEVGLRDKTTGQIILTNPYDVATVSGVEGTKAQLLSQLLFTYSDTAGTYVNFTSYTDSAKYGQIKMKPTRYGLRVEYTVGKEQSKYLVPKQIEKSSFEENILSFFPNTSSPEYRRLTAYYKLVDNSDPKLTPTMINSNKTKWPITEKYAIYILDESISNRELEMLEGYIENNTEYSFEKMEEDYSLVDYVDTSAAPALFRFAIEYSLDEHGIKISLPASSIKYDSSNYTLHGVKVLPYFGAGSNENEGFTMIPDGSGTITRFEEIKNTAFTLTGKMYGKDYSFHSITGTTQETMRIPAFGVIESQNHVGLAPAVEETKETQETVEETQEAAEETAEETAEEVETVVTEQIEEEFDILSQPEAAFNGIRRKGYVAYLEEGDALVEISTSHGGTVHKYSSAYYSFYPKPSDTYSLTGISETGDATWSVTSERRYTGDYTLRVFPLFGDNIDYVDMAVEVRNYLEKTGVLTKLDKSTDVSEDTALYVENFGTIKTQQKFAGFPVKVQTPLTTFEQSKEMITELKENGINNVNLKLSGWYNGGMQYTAPAKLKIPGALGGKDGLLDLVKFAKENGVGIYPDMDFMYVDNFSLGDGFGAKKHSVKTIDGRSASKRNYNALYQGFDSIGSLIIAPPVMEKFYNKISSKYADLGVGAISVGSAGSDLSSDHNKDYALNREESKQYVQNFLEAVNKDNEKVMVNGGNAYAYKYADHILGIPLDSSQNINTSQAIPFMGMVLHGYTEFAGPALNLEGNYEQSVLKAIENGANLYFVVSKDNTPQLKLFPEFSKYYAIKYDNWKQDMFDTYKEVNEAMKGVKYSFITSHEQLDTRVVKVGYDNGTQFILNYNTHDIELSDGTTVQAMGFAVK